MPLPDEPEEAFKVLLELLEKLNGLADTMLANSKQLTGENLPIVPAFMIHKLVDNQKKVEAQFDQAALKWADVRDKITEAHRSELDETFDEVRTQVLTMKAETRRIERTKFGSPN